MPKSKYIDQEQIRQNIEVLNRDPFREQLARLLRCSPNDAALKAFARKNPDKWAQALKQLAALAGYQDKQSVSETNIYNMINVMPDSQLQDELNKTLKQINSLGEQVEQKQDRSEPERGLTYEQPQEQDSPEHLEAVPREQEEEGKQGDQDFHCSSGK